MCKYGFTAIITVMPCDQVYMECVPELLHPASFAPCSNKQQQLLFFKEAVTVVCLQTTDSIDCHHQKSYQLKLGK